MKAPIAQRSIKTISLLSDQAVQDNETALAVFVIDSDTGSLHFRVVAEGLDCIRQQSPIAQEEVLQCMNRLVNEFRQMVEAQKGQPS